TETEPYSGRTCQDARTLPLVRRTFAQTRIGRGRFASTCRFPALVLMCRSYPLRRRLRRKYLGDSYAMHHTDGRRARPRLAGRRGGRRVRRLEQRVPDHELLPVEPVCVLRAAVPAAVLPVRLICAAVLLSARHDIQDRDLLRADHHLPHLVLL